MLQEDTWDPLNVVPPEPPPSVRPVITLGTLLSAVLVAAATLLTGPALPTAPTLANPSLEIPQSSDLQSSG